MRRPASSISRVWLGLRRRSCKRLQRDCSMLSGAASASSSISSHCRNAPTLDMRKSGERCSSARQRAPRRGRCQCRQQRLCKPRRGRRETASTVVVAFSPSWREERPAHSRSCSSTFRRPEISAPTRAFFPPSRQSESTPLYVIANRLDCTSHTGHE